MMRDCGCDLENRVEAITGDISIPGFGLAEQDLKWVIVIIVIIIVIIINMIGIIRLLEDEVSVVFHNAATVKFNEDLNKVPPTITQIEDFKF